MNWVDITIGDVCNVGRGSSPRPINNKSYFEGGEIPWIKIADATSSGKYIYITKEHVNNYGASYSRLLSQGSLILATSGVSLGQVKFLGVSGCIHDGWLYLDKFNGIDKEFLYYTLLLLGKYFHSKSYGAAIQNINTDTLRRTIISLPPTKTQQKIASILSAYDDLIENNLNRIKLLEEAAQSIYKEWFVNFRFPGYESAKFGDDGLPEGWEMNELNDLVDVTSSKRVYLADYVEEGIPFYRGKEIIQKSNHDSISESYFISQSRFNEFQSKFGSPKPGDILLTGVGTIGHSYLVNNNDGDFYFKDGNLLWLRKVINQISSEYIFLFLKSEAFKGIVNSINIGSSQKALTIRSIKAIKIVVPDSLLINNFVRIIKPILRQIELLSATTKTLKEARDILLPRLIDRRIEV